MSDAEAKGSRPTAAPPKGGKRCPRCHRTAPKQGRCMLCNPSEGDLLARSHPKEYGDGFDFFTGRVHPRFVDILHKSNAHLYPEGSKEWDAWWAGHNHAEECDAREKRRQAEMTTIETVGQLRKALIDIPDDTPLAAYDPYHHLLTVEKTELVARRLDIHTPTLVIKTR